MIGFGFTEVMEGMATLTGEGFDRPMRFSFDVRAPDILGMLREVTGEAVGTVTVDGFASGAHAEGRLVLSPVKGRTIRYVFDFEGDDRQRYHFDGAKSIDWLRAATTWTTLPGRILNESDEEVGAAELRFIWKRHFPGLLRSFRLRSRRRPPDLDAEAALDRRRARAFD